jgi:hypothetical protein
MELTVEKLMNAIVKCLTDGTITANTLVAVESNFDHKVTAAASTVTLDTDLFTGKKTITVRA